MKFYIGRCNKAEYTAKSEKMRESIISPINELTVDNILKKLIDFQRIDFKSQTQSELENFVNELYRIYRDFINLPAYTYVEEAFREAEKNGKIVDIDFIKRQVETQFQADDITDRMNGNEISREAFGLAVANRLAHLFDYLFFRGNLEFAYPQNLPIEFRTKANCKCMQNELFAIKNMFIARIVEKVTEDPKIATNIAISTDEKNGKSVLKIHTGKVTKPTEREWIPKDVTIAVHVLNEELISPLKKMRQNEELLGSGGSKPKTLFVDELMSGEEIL